MSFYRLSKRKWFYKSRDGNFDAKRNLWKWVNQEEYLASYDAWHNYYSTAVALRNLYDELDYQLDSDFSILSDSLVLRELVPYLSIPTCMTAKALCGSIWPL